MGLIQILTEIQVHCAYFIPFIYPTSCFDKEEDQFFWHNLFLANLCLLLMNSLSSSGCLCQLLYDLLQHLSSIMFGEPVHNSTGPHFCLFFKERHYFSPFPNLWNPSFLPWLGKYNAQGSEISSPSSLSTLGRSSLGSPDLNSFKMIKSSLTFSFISWPSVYPLPCLYNFS